MKTIVNFLQEYLIKSIGKRSIQYQIDANTAKESRLPKNCTTCNCFLIHTLQRLLLLRNAVMFKLKN